MADQSPPLVPSRLAALLLSQTHNTSTTITFLPQSAGDSNRGSLKLTFQFDDLIVVTGCYSTFVTQFAGLI